LSWRTVEIAGVRVERVVVTGEEERKIRVEGLRERLLRRESSVG